VIQPSNVKDQFGYSCVMFYTSDIIEAHLSMWI